jgi:hypothetical protein
VTTPYDRLTAAQERIRDKSKWTQGATARNKSGTQCGHSDINACQWCGFGAIMAAGDDDLVAWEYIRDASISLFNASPIDINDDLGHDAIMQVFTKARELALEEANTV